MNVTKPMKKIGKGFVLLGLISAAYSIELHFDTKKIENFCSEMQVGRSVTEVAAIANKYGIGFKDVRDPTSVAKQKLGIKLNDQANTWFFVVGAPTTMGEYACGVYHNNKVILSSQLRK